MGSLGYATSMSLDGYIADAQGDFQWAAPSVEIFDAHRERMAGVSSEVMGRRTYELMRYWDAPPAGEEWTAAEADFARRWRSTEKVVVSSSMTPDDFGDDAVRLLPSLGLGELEEIVAEATGMVEIFGPTTAADAIRAGMVDVFEFFVVPVVLGGGLRALPDDARLELELTNHRIFDNGVTYLRYTPRVPIPAIPTSG